MCNCSIEIADGEGELVCPGCGEILGYRAARGAFTAYSLPEDEDSYEFVAREWEKAVDAGEYERAERLRREMERMVGETSKEEEIEAWEGEEGEEMDEVLSKDDYGESGEEEDFWDEEDDEFDEDFEDEEF